MMTPQKSLLHCFYIFCAFSLSCLFSLDWWERVVSNMPAFFLHPKPFLFFLSFSLSLTAAWWEQTHPGTTIQLEERHKAQGQHLYRRQSGVWVRPVHSLFPDLTQRACQSPVQFLWCGDCLPSLQPKAHRHHLPCAPKVPGPSVTKQGQFET